MEKKLWKLMLFWTMATGAAGESNVIKRNWNTGLTSMRPCVGPLNTRKTTPFSLMPNPVRSRVTAKCLGVMEAESPSANWTGLILISSDSPKGV